MRPGARQVRRVRYTEEERGINFTSVLDIAFIILVLFFISTFFVLETGREDAGLADQTAMEVVYSGPPILVTIDASGIVSIEGRLHERNLIQASLEQLQAERQGARLEIDVHADADTRVLALVIDAARAAGIENVDVSTGESL